MLFGNIESRAASILEQFNKGYYELTRDNKEAFAYFVALMLVRIPADRLAVEGGFRAKVEQFREQFPERYAAGMGEFAEYCGISDEAATRQKLSSTYSLTRILRDIPLNASILKAHNWFLYRTASRQGFITSDRPALYHDRDRENPMGYFSMPLSPTLHFISRPKLEFWRCIRSKLSTHTREDLMANLQGAEPSIRVSKAEPKRIKFANQIIIDRSFKYVFATSFDPSLGRAIQRMA